MGVLVTTTRFLVEECKFNLLGLRDHKFRGSLGGCRCGNRRGTGLRSGLPDSDPEPRLSLFPESETASPYLNLCIHNMC